MNATKRRDFMLLSSVGLASLLVGCRSEESEAPPTPNPTPTPTPNQPTDPGRVRPFRLDFRSAGGHVMAQDGALSLQQWTSWLRVRSDQGVAELVLTRHNGDLVDRPVGRFRQALDEAALLELQGAIEATKWAELPEPLIGDPTSNWLTLEYVAGEQTLRREFSASAQAFLGAIGPLMERLTATMSAPLAQPIAALAIEVTPSFELRLRNVGTEPIVLTDPRVPASPNADPRAQLLVAAQPGGYSMPSWTAIDLPALQVGQPEVHVLAAGAELAIQVEWKPTLRGPCLLQAVWQDYGGPIRTEPGQLPFMPLPEQGPSPAPGPYPVRGAAFSSYASFDA